MLKKSNLIFSIVTSLHLVFISTIIGQEKKLDLPAYAIKNYRISCKVKDGEGNILSAGFISLPVIKPGDDILSGLNASQLYEFKLAAINGIGVSNFSALKK